MKKGASLDAPFLFIRNIVSCIPVEREHMITASS